MLIGARMVVPLRQATAETCGGKAASLGILLRAGLPVPDGFVIAFDAFREAHSRGEDGNALPPELADALAPALRALGDAPVAVRSSASGEDTLGASAAGQHESVLGVRGVGAVAAAVRTCWDSLHSPRAVAYRRGHDREHAEVTMAVLVQRLVDPDVAGVMFAAPSGTGDGTRIEASWGLGVGVVGGLVTPDAYLIAPDGAITRTVGDKTVRIDRDGARLVARAIHADDRDRPVLDDATVQRLALLGQRVADVLGEAQDVEWAIAGGRVWIVQARPITAAPPPPPVAAAESGSTLTGTAGSAGTATGTARVVRGPADFSRVRPGDILVCPFTDPAWTPLLHVAAGVVTETGGVLSHAAIVARERRIPAVLGVPHATRHLRDGVPLTIDGSAGTITIDLTREERSWESDTSTSPVTATPTRSAS
jgi:pyruvate, water dikinase